MGSYLLGLFVIFGNALPKGVLCKMKSLRPKTRRNKPRQKRLGIIGAKQQKTKNYFFNTGTMMGNEKGRNNKPLEGLMVVAMEQAVAAPLATARLAAAGARVIKIERPGGDFARNYDDAACGDSSYFAWINQHKESIVLDIKTDADRALLDRLISKADFYVQNFAPGALARLGLGSKDLQAKHEKLIACDISGFGESEAMAGMKGYDLLVQAESGLVATSGGPNEIGRLGVSICDIGAGMTAHAAMLEALVARFQHGKGDVLKVSLFDVAAEWMTVPLTHHDYGKGAPKRQGLMHPSIAPYGAYETSDGLLTLISIQNEREWVRLCEIVLGAGALGQDPRFASNNLRVANRTELENNLQQLVSKMDGPTFRARLADASIAMGAINEVADLSNHGALRRHMVVNSLGVKIDLPAHPVIRSMMDHLGEGQPAKVPGLDEHGAAIRAEFS